MPNRNWVVMMLYEPPLLQNRESEVKISTMDTFEVPCSTEVPDRCIAPLLSAVQKGLAGLKVQRDELLASPNMCGLLGSLQDAPQMP